MKPASASFACRCDGISRRDFLHLGLLTTFGLSLADVLRLHAGITARPPARGTKAASCILLWLHGGPSHLDTFDLKPDAPSEVRSQFKSIKSRSEEHTSELQSHSDLVC